MAERKSKSLRWLLALQQSRFSSNNGVTISILSDTVSVRERKGYLSLKTPCSNVLAISFLKVHIANTEESRCHKNCKTDRARARRVLAGGAASESDTLKEEVLATGLLEDNLLAS
ncbi:hypothetical protein F2Q69_00050823 [Brassica cretica]|uniref:Uncharacterized protein n=1 Tax=Brassica cretica TaxID=69181 RepID=A0A8S9PRU2_BRACR|nr:hypothetical protein F2Q69_00050823 [Brassica cretica]